MSAIRHFTFVIESLESNLRLDAVLADRLEGVSRSHAAWLIQQGCVAVDGRKQKPAYRLKPGQTVTGEIPEASSSHLTPEKEPLDIVYEDDVIIVVNKPPGLVVHPAAGHPEGTLVNRLLYHCPQLPGIKAERRPGIVHRLDKDTSGILVVAKDNYSLLHLARQFKERQVQKTYMALVYGIPSEEKGTIQLPIGRHLVDRKKMAILPAGREAVTCWRIKEVYKSGISLLEVDLKTGRTHQIRVHCKAIGHPIVGDPIYGRKKAAIGFKKQYPQTYCALEMISRQMLHAFRLTLSHPDSGRRLTFEADLPEDMNHLLNALRNNAET